MRWRQVQQPSGDWENARRRRMAPHTQGMGRRPRLSNIGREEIVVRFQLPGGTILGGPAQLEGIAVKAVISQRGAQAAGEQTVRLGTQKLRPAGADPPRRWPESRGAQDVCNRGGGDVDAEPQQLTLDAHVAPARILPRQPRDQTARVGRKRATTGPTTVFAWSLQQCPVPAA